jgi:hypothetical protein
MDVRRGKYRPLLVERLGPIIVPGMDARMGTNINGPSLIRVPEWLENRLGRYYLYFAAHRGDYIRLAYADDLRGPWQTYAPGVLPLAESLFTDHIASPDVHIDDGRRQIIMYYHGVVHDDVQMTRVATSSDGLHFDARDELLGRSYFRVFRWRDAFYALAMPGVVYRTDEGLTGFREGPTLFSERMRHSAVRVMDHTLQVFSTNAGDCPECILYSEIDLRSDWKEWTATGAVALLEPETSYEGADLPLEPSERGEIDVPARQLRDPAIYMEDGRTFLIYAIAGERGLALAELH